MKQQKLSAKQYISQVYFETIRNVVKGEKAGKGLMADLMRNNARCDAVRDLVHYSSEMGMKTFLCKLKDRRDGLNEQNIIKTHCEELKNRQEIFIIMIEDFIDIEKNSDCVIFQLPDNLSALEMETANEDKFNQKHDIESQRDAWQEYYGWAD